MRRTIIFSDHPPPRFGVLLLHGYTGNPDTMRPLQAPLESLGVEVSLPLLRGHGAASPQALIGVTWADWLADGADALTELCTRVDRVILLGHSMGALGRWRHQLPLGADGGPDPAEPWRSHRA